MSPTRRHRQNRIYLSYVVASSHFLLTVLGLFDRLEFTVPTRYLLLGQTLDSRLWTLFHALCFIAIFLTIWLKRGEVSALGAATGVMGAWSFLSLLWGLSTPTPVSLAGPILGTGIAILSYMLTLSWARSPRNHKGVI